jgi:hypothetical protein
MKLRAASAAPEPVWCPVPAVMALVNTKGRCVASALERESFYAQPVKERDLFHDEFKTFF